MDLRGLGGFGAGLQTHVASDARELLVKLTPLTHPDERQETIATKLAKLGLRRLGLGLVVESPELQPTEKIRALVAEDLLRFVGRGLAVAERGERVRIDGWLVQIDAGRWRWRSSLTREDSGGGACELVYVCAVTRE